MNQINDFVAEMRSQGCEPINPDAIIADDEIHRYDVQGDKKGSENGSYKLAIEPDGFAYGWFTWWKDGINHPFSSKPKKGITPEERAEHRDRVKKAKAASEAKRKASANDAAERAKTAWDNAVRSGTTEYLSRKQIGLHGCRISDGRVLVPMRVGTGIVSMQYIWPDGRKLFEKGADQAGAYLSIAKRADDLSVIAIVEGFSTGASVREATGWPVIVAFNAGGLKPVAKIISKKYPDARIVICGDNDHETKNAKGEAWNVGVEKANQAAVAIGGAQVVVPLAGDGITDWNDVHCQFGLDAVRNAIMAAPSVVQESEIECDEIGPTEQDIDPLSEVRPLGHNRGMYYFFPRSGGQVLEFSAGALGKIQNLYQLADRGFWDMHYNPDGKSSDSAITSAASAHLMAECKKKGIFALRDARGIGAWSDNGNLVVNCGDVLVADGLKCVPSEYVGKYVYEAGVKVIDLDCEPLLDAESNNLLSILRRLSWKHNTHAEIVAGWIVVGMVGSALRWRPHITISGPKGSGKSTVVNNIIQPVVGDIGVNGDGGSTEPGVRVMLKGSGRPFIMDEAESESRTARANMDLIMTLIRKASSGGKVINANGEFTSRSCFCLAAINPNIHQGADIDRNTMVELRQDTTPGFANDWASLKADIVNTFTDEFSRRLMARTCANLDTLLKNIDTFTTSAAAAYNNQRQGDQMGALLAGAYSLTTTKVITPAQADAIVADRGLSGLTSKSDMSDAEKLVMHIMSARVRFDSLGRGMESSLGDLLDRACDNHDAESTTAINALRGYGLKISDDRLLIANTHPQLSKILRDTPWGVWRRTLGDYDGSENYGNRTVSFGPGLNSKVISLPLTRVLGGDSSDGETEIELEF